MKRSFRIFILLFPVITATSSCQKWKDKQAQDLGFTNTYCNIPSAVNYNWNFPGIEDNSTCVFPSDPFTGNYTFEDSVYIDGIDSVIPYGSIGFSIVKRDSARFDITGYCSSRSLPFTANRYYHATSDSVLAGGTQLFCRDLDTLNGTLDYRPADSSLYIEFTIKSDTLTAVHRGRAYKK
ncbi:MAG: hypothetical protein QM743_13005 [Chitinophagaceae bacterium]